MSRHWFANVPCVRPDCDGLVCVTGKDDHDRGFSPCDTCGAGDWSDREKSDLTSAADGHERAIGRHYDGPDTLAERS